MNADNWAVCPRCLLNTKKRLERTQRKEQQFIVDNYGNLEYHVFFDKLEKIQEEISTLELLCKNIILTSTELTFDKDIRVNNAFHTLREGYTLGIMSKEEEFHIKYSASCDKCGFKFNYEYQMYIGDVIREKK